MFTSTRAFTDPPWNAALDVQRVLATIPAEAQIAGMFFLAVLEGAKRRGVTLPLARDRYIAFSFYPISEFAAMLVQAAELFHPGLSLRQALRSMGAMGPKAFIASTLGKVTLGAAQVVHETVAAIAKTYEINIRPSRCTIVKSMPSSMVLSLEGVHYFLDAHHVGVFEGTLSHAGVSGRVKIASYSRSSAELLLEW
jgi:uncharacterized protein (TIGR02265 family)